MNGNLKTQGHQIIQSWIDLIDTGDAMLRAGLRQDFGDRGADAAYQIWRNRERRERDLQLEQLARSLSRSRGRS